MRAIPLTVPIARAIAQDAANRQMRERVRHSREPAIWNLDDYNLAASKLAELLDYCAECGRTTPEHSESCEQQPAKEHQNNE